MACFFSPNTFSPHQPPPYSSSESGFSLEEIRSGPKARFFGIGHIILAALGIITSIGLAIVLIQTSQVQAEFEKNLHGSGDPATASLFATILRYGVLTTLVTLISAIPLLIGGILLLRRRPSAVIWSNLYAIFSITSKIGMTAYVLTHFPFTSASLISLEKISDLVFSAALFTYPVLSLILLNRPAFRRWLAGAGAAR